MGRLVVFDVETTGLDPKEDHIVEFGAVSFNYDGEELSDYNTLIKTSIRMDPKVVSIHGITNKMLNEYGKDLENVAGHIHKLLSECDMWGGQNLQFDIGFVTEALNNVGYQLECKPVLDSLDISRRFIPLDLLRSRRLAKLCEFLLVPLDSAHRAVHDSRATGQCIFKMASHIGLSLEELLDTEAQTVGQWALGRDPFEAQFLGLPQSKHYG